MAKITIKELQEKVEGYKITIIDLKDHIVELRTKLDTVKKLITVINSL